MAQKANPTLAVFFLVLLLACLISLSAAQSDDPPVADDGPYEVGVQPMELIDEIRDDRVLKATIWYPALISEDAPRPHPPDMSGAPYPLILISHFYNGDPAASVRLYINRLVSHGFVVAGVNHKDSSEFPPTSGGVAQNLVNRPLDVLFLLDELAALTDSPLVGLMATDNVGVVGESFGGYTTFAVSGARLDLQHFMEWCSTSPETGVVRICNWQDNWDVLADYGDNPTSVSDDGLLPAMTDERIQAILPIIPCFAQLFGERGLATVTVPTLILAASADEYCPHDTNAAFFFDHIDSADRYLTVFEGRTHGAVLDQVDALPQYALAFFGLYLQGNSDYAHYLTPEFASTFQRVTVQAHTGAE